MTKKTTGGAVRFALGLKQSVWCGAMPSKPCLWPANYGTNSGFHFELVILDSVIPGDVI